MSECSCHIHSTGGCYSCGKRCVGVLLDACSWCSSNHSHFFCMKQINKNRGLVDYLCKDCAAGLDASLTIPRKSARILKLNSMYFNDDMIVSISFDWTTKGRLS
ncbi:unnamed protein product [Cuscuta epithymum]|uniref:PHD-type domain-containing protein n=1 Tax=Cuscuta epithymum TaxID=186058 RepID=A0AAV0FJR3_9ASTE|nr:unnamed protein product [Cuscuta epithymum]